LRAVGNVTLGVNAAASWNTSQGILPPQLELISLQGTSSTMHASSPVPPSPGASIFRRGARPTVEAPNIGGLTAANNIAGAGAKTDAPTGGVAHDQPSIIIVEVLGYGGGGGDEPADQEQKRPKSDDKRSYDTNSPYQIVGVGALDDRQISALAAEKHTESRQER
jgi:hypothetical protein